METFPLNDLISCCNNAASMAGFRVKFDDFAQ